MYRKSFASLSISPHKLKVVKLSKDKKRCVVAATMDVPDGLIQNGKLTDVPKFTALVSQMWKKFSVREKSVGLIVPEVSTYMKSFSVPVVPDDELDEAVRWQVSEYLPKNHEEMVLDWKIVARGEKHCEVLTLAIPKDVLSGYVTGVVSAGLLPLLVETTSVSLERIAESADVGKIVIYRSKGVAVVVTIASKKVLSSSVMYEPTDEQLTNSVLQIISRSSGILSRVAVCGNGLTQEYVNSLHARVAIPVDLLHPSAIGLTDDRVQEYVIPLSQQQSDPQAPASIYTINLLPPEWVARYKKELREIKIWTTTLIGSVVFWGCLLVMLGAYIMLSEKLNSFNSGSDGKSGIELASVSAQINSINGQITKAQTAMVGIHQPTQIINKAFAKVSSGIEIRSIDLNIETKKMIIVGSATDRPSLLAFKKSLEEEKPMFSRVNLPISSLLAEDGIPFEVIIDLKI